jgi:hypothetical protein
MDFGKGLCACLISLELCPVHKKKPHVEIQVVPHVRHVVDDVVKATTATVAHEHLPPGRGLDEATMSWFRPALHQSQGSQWYGSASHILYMSPPTDRDTHP